MRAAAPQVRDAASDERRTLCSCLGRAFEDDPVAEFLFPDPATRVARMASFYRGVVSDTSRHGRFLTEPKLRGGALWQAPSPPKPGAFRAFLNGMRMTLSLREAMPRAQDLGAVVMEAHPREPHWYLAILGTDPDHQGSGIGSALIQPILKHCDETSSPAYLESSKESNIPFYQRHGFEVTRDLPVASGPTLWAMWREPQ